MKKVFNFLTAASLLTVFALFYGCKKDPDMPTLTTTAISGITTTTATSGGNITSDGGAEVTARGVCWGTATKPTIAGTTKTSDSKGIGIFTSNITGLTPSTLYYVRAYATNSAGTNYGNEVSFTTLGLSQATLTTTAVTVFTHNTATAGGNISSDGNAPVSERGVYFGTANNPQTTGTKVAAAAGGTGAFTCGLTNLVPGTLYYVIAFATNSQGTAFGSVVQFTTAAVAPTVTTAAVTIFTQTTATAGGNVTSTGGATVDERGVYYGTTANPQTTGTKVAAGTAGSGEFTVNLASLTPATIYYVVAYAKNSVNTSYGSQVSFTTSPVLRATLTTTAPASITNVSASIGGNITADGGGAISERGICWSTTPGTGEGWTQVAAASPGTGTYSVSLTGLAEGTLYYIRAYAENSAGTAFGDAVTVLTYMSDRQNNIYKTVKIGDQIWMAENLEVTQYNGGAAIANVPLASDWIALTTPAYCWWNNDIDNKDAYGALYNWYAANRSDLCPTGWHVPTDPDWTVLTDLLGGVTVAGGKLKEAGTEHWLTPNTGATNETGFTALPTGFRYRLNGNFNDAGTLVYFWSSTQYEFDPIKGYYRELFNDNATVYREAAYKTAGKYVRCLKN